MGLLSIFKGNKKEKDCCNIEIVEIKEEKSTCCTNEANKEQKKEA
ncbi:hypothetical protein [Priestia megaterium]|nr:hypothetical protein [Priestia megaterium]